MAPPHLDLDPSRPLSVRMAAFADELAEAGAAEAAAAVREAGERYREALADGRPLDALAAFAEVEFVRAPRLGHDDASAAGE